MSHSICAVDLRCLALALPVLVWFPQQLHAHRPVFVKHAATSADTAIPLTEPHVSQVVYREITKRSSEIWLSFKVPEDFDLHIQIGVPVIDRLKKFRPAMAVVGPGLPSEDLPFKTPKATGAKVFTTSKVSKPRLFHEHFTGTRSWILRSEKVPLGKAGRYYLVAYSPTKQTGKLWVAIGKKESFKAEHWRQFLTWRKLIRKFHEIK